MTVAAAVSARSRQNVVRHFAEATAFRPESAIAYMPGRHDDQSSFANLQRVDVIRSAAPGLYYLDQAALARERQRWKRTIIIVLAVLAISLTIVLTACLAVRSLNE